MVLPQQIDRDSVTVEIDQGSASINGISIQNSGPPGMFYKILGQPSRVGDASEIPAPLDHRNNQCHYYDALGIVLNEHHYTYQIQGIRFVFDVQASPHPTEEPFSGHFNLGDLLVKPGTLERDLKKSGLRLTSQLSGTWSTYLVESDEIKERLSVWVTTEGPKLRSGRRSKRKEIIYVSLCLLHDPWDQSFRQEK